MGRKLLVTSALHIIARVASLSLSISLITVISVYDSYTTIATLVSIGIAYTIILYIYLFLILSNNPLVAFREYTINRTAFYILKHQNWYDVSYMVLYFVRERKIKIYIFSVLIYFLYIVILRAILRLYFSKGIQLFVVKFFGIFNIHLISGGDWEISNAIRKHVADKSERSVARRD